MDLKGPDDRRLMVEVLRPVREGDGFYFLHLSFFDAASERPPRQSRSFHRSLCYKKRGNGLCEVRNPGKKKEKKQQPENKFFMCARIYLQANYSQVFQGRRLLCVRFTMGCKTVGVECDSPSQ